MEKQQQAQEQLYKEPGNKIDFIDGFLVVAVGQRLIYSKIDSLLGIESYSAQDE